MSVVEIFADVRCPFTHVGLRRLVERRDELAADVTLRIRAWPLELVNDAPLDPAMISEEVDDIRSQVAPDLFAGFDPARFPTTSLPALALADAAYGVDLATGERVSLALREAMFERGEDIADTEVLQRIAVTHAVTGAIEDEGPVHRDWREGRQRGVIGSPHYFIGTSGFFCPALHIERVDGLLDISVASEEFEAFLARVFESTTG